MPTVYNLDVTGQSIDNLILNEHHVVSASATSPYNVIIPKVAPFYSDSLVVDFIDDLGNTTRLTEGTDYLCGFPFISASRDLSKPVYGAIALTDLSRSGLVRLTQYQTLGGSWTVDVSAVITKLAESLFNPLIVSWEVIAEYPTAFPPTLHGFNLEDMVGLSELIAALQSIQVAIAAKVVPTQIVTPERSINKRTIGLGLVENFPMATVAEALSGESNRSYMTPFLGKTQVDFGIDAYAQSQSIYAASSAPSNGSSYKIGDFVRNTSPSVLIWTDGEPDYLNGTQYIVVGWTRMTLSGGGALGIDWRENRVLTR